jgi:hypothetical protein
LGYKVDLTYINQTDQDMEKDKVGITDDEVNDDDNDNPDWDDITNFF